MNKIPLSAFCGALFVCGLLLASAHAENAAPPAPTAPSAPSAPAEKSFTQSMKDGYHSLRNNISEAFGGYSGESEADEKLFMEHYREDLSDYHDAVRKARAKYRRARLNDQKAYLEHHNVLPMTENLDGVGHPH